MRIGNYAFDQQLAMEIGQQVLFALLILAATWALAWAARWAFEKMVEKVEVLKRDTGGGRSIGHSLGMILSLVIWLAGLLAILRVLELGDATAPLQTMLDDFIAFVPNLVFAVLIFFIGLMVARVLRDLVVTALQTVNFDKWINKGGVDSVTGNSALSKTIGAIAYVATIIPVAIFAIDRLQLEGVSAPVGAILVQIQTAFWMFVFAAVLLAMGFFIARFVAQMLEEILPGLGVDRAIASTQLLPEGARASKGIATIAQIAIVLSVAIVATRLLGIPEISAMLDQILDLGGRIIFGAVVILAGFLIANLLAKLIAGSGATSLAATVVRWTAILLSTFMGLQFMGVGEEIVEMAFGALAVGGALAAALAFGLGGRETAGKMLEDWRNRH
ncbi:MAG TPA: mechanosensitive ion channel [Sphingomonadaceae bacterium]|nr:mechanosensitive ion channel [Sphingomonadaceae bacterium]